MVLDTKLKASESSRCWSFYNNYVAQSPGPRPYANKALNLASELSMLLPGLTSLLQTVKPSSEALSYYATLSNVALYNRTRLAEVRESLLNASPTKKLITYCEHAPEKIYLFLQLLRSYGMTLATGLVTNIVLRMYFPNKIDELVQSAWQFTCELVSLATEASQFKPLGAAFTKALLSTAWSVGDQAARKDLEKAIASKKLDFEIERAKVTSGRLNNSLDALRCLIANRSPIGSSVLASPEGHASLS